MHLRPAMLRALAFVLAAATLAPTVAHADELSATAHASPASHKRFNLATNPIGYAFKNYGLSASVAVTDHVTVRGNVEHYDHGYYAATGTLPMALVAIEHGNEASLSAPIYLRHAFSGLFFEPGVRYVQHTDEPGHAAYAGPMALVGYHWTADWGLNLAAAVGGSSNLNDHDDMPVRSTLDVDLTGYLRIGFAF